MTSSACLEASEALLPRFLAKFSEDGNGCWLWTAARTHDGYGRFKIGGKTRMAHVVAYETLVGLVPDGLELDHLCRVRRCCNPEHLEPVTQRENLMRGQTPAARNAAKTHCPQGHSYSYSDGNLYIHPSGSRICRRCSADATARWRTRNAR